MLLDGCADCHAASRWGDLVFTLAVYNGPEELMKYVIEKGINPSLRSEFYTRPATALGAIAHRPGDQVSIVRMLLEAGADARH